MDGRVGTSGAVRLDGAVETRSIGVAGGSSGCEVEPGPDVLSSEADRVEGGGSNDSVVACCSDDDDADDNEDDAAMSGEGRVEDDCDSERGGTGGG